MTMYERLADINVDMIATIGGVALFGQIDINDWRGALNEELLQIVGVRDASCSRGAPCCFLSG